MQNNQTVVLVTSSFVLKPDLQVKNSQHVYVHNITVVEQTTLHCLRFIRFKADKPSPSRVYILNIHLNVRY